MKSPVSIFVILILAPFVQCKSIQQVATAPKTSSQCSSNAAINGVKNSIASGMAAACSKALLAPFDTIKTVQQQGINGGKALGVVEAAGVVMSRPKGFIELYAGLGVSAVGAMPSVGLYFGVYSYSKEKLKPFLKRVMKPTNERTEAMMHTISIAMAAGIGNTIASFSRVPYEVVKQKLQTAEYSSTIGAMTNMYQTAGLRGFFPVGGVTIQMIRDIPYAIVTLLTYECLRDHWVNKREKASWRDMVAGATAGGVGSYATNPMDVIKTRLQVDSSLYNGSVWNCMKATYVEGGSAAFLRGSVPRLMHKIPANGAFFVFYELFRRVLGVEDSSSREEK